MNNILKFLHCDAANHMLWLMIVSREGAQQFLLRTSKFYAKNPFSGFTIHKILPYRRKVEIMQRRIDMQELKTTTPVC